MIVMCFISLDNALFTNMNVNKGKINLHNIFNDKLYFILLIVILSCENNIKLLSFIENERTT